MIADELRRLNLASERDQIDTVKSLVEGTLFGIELTGVQGTYQMRKLPDGELSR